ncbi:MAG: aminotransferase class III-fold pyridoxal phosphate-dependent enzyme [Gemmatimonadaceae bacterium]|nr:aminotransferase class III-fold pyridoxal phosphate-dependent enzyme [Gemmatimonadaceae bacterium]
MTHLAFPAPTDTRAEPAAARAVATVDAWVARPRSWHWRLNPLWRAVERLRLSWAKHPSLLGHPRIALRLSRWLPEYHYAEHEAFGVDGAPATVVARRRAAFNRLAQLSRERSPKTLAASGAIAARVSDAAFVNAHRVPFQFRRLVEAHLPVGSFVDETDGPRVRDLDGNWSWDLGGSYGVNLFGHEFYKRCLESAAAEAAAFGTILGPYHPVVQENVDRLCAISGMDEVSFHMSGTEAVMQAMRLARYHTGRSHIVRFVGAYHGWSDGVQAGPGNPRPVGEVYTLPEMRERTLAVLRARDDIAAVLVNPIQAMHPNSGPPTDATLVTGQRPTGADLDAYRAWLRDLRAVCDERRIVLIFDEVFLGFRLGLGGAQEYFGVRADLVTYGKTLGGGLPIGVLCGKAPLMRRFKDGKAADLCFARGTFNAHPQVMAAMAAFLRRLEDDDIRDTYRGLEERWTSRVARLNGRLEAAGVPVRVSHLVSVWMTRFTQPGRYHWLLQYYLRAHGLTMGWIGTGRFILSHDLSETDCDAIFDRFVAAAVEMQQDGWFWRDPDVPDHAVVRSIKQRVLRETRQALFRASPRASSDRSAHPAGA